MMGANSSLESNFDEVELQTPWRVGLLVEVRGVREFVVRKIEPAEKYEQLTTGELDGENVYVYSYRGSNIISDTPAAVYKIYLATFPVVTPEKVGGSVSYRRRSRAKRQEKLTINTRPNLTIDGDPPSKITAYD
jgi:hypothetical protein